MSEKRLKITIRSKAVAQLEQLKERTKASTNTEVIQNSLRVYKAILDFSDEDGNIIVEKPDGQRVRLILP